jgi:TolB-like protein/Tfp pilus assembly protein PilF
MRVISPAAFFEELIRRNVWRAAALYAAGAWLLVQVATQVFPFFHIAEWVVRWIVVAAIIGFPFVLVFSWFYDLTPAGFRRDSGVEDAASSVRNVNQKLDRLIIAALALAVVLLLANQFVLHRGLPTGSPASTLPDKSIAVLPLVNEGGDASEQYFSDGLSEDLITALSQFAGVRVIGRSSAFQFRDSKEDSRMIGAKLGVAHLLEGSVRHLDGKVRISAALIRAADGTTLWSQKYDRRYQDLFALQDDITRAVAEELKTTLLRAGGIAPQTDRPGSGNLDAYNAYLQGNFRVAGDNEADLRAAIDAYNRAIRIDPGYVQAYAALSVAQNNLASEFLGGAAAREMLGRARTAANAALRLDPNVAASHSALGTLYYYGDLDWNNAEIEFRQALHLAPNDPMSHLHYAWVLATLGRMPEAIEQTRRAIASDTLNSLAQSYLGMYLLEQGQFDEAESVTRKAHDLQPASQYAAAVFVAVRLQTGKIEEARAAVASLPPAPVSRVLHVNVEQAAGNRAEADAGLQLLIEKDSDSAAFQIAQIYAQRGDGDKVFEWLERTWANRDPGVSYLLFDVYLKPYRSDPRFAAFCRTIGLPLPAGQTNPAVLPPSPARTGATSIAIAQAQPVEPR